MAMTDNKTDKTPKYQSIDHKTPMESFYFKPSNTN